MPDHDYYAKTPTSQAPVQVSCAKYGASPDDIVAVTQFATAAGLAIAETSAVRRSVTVSGTVAQMEKAFGVTLGRYEVLARRAHRGEPAPDRAAAATETYRGRDGFVHVPRELAEAVIGVFGLDNRNITHNNMSGDPPSTSKLTVPEVVNLYHFPTTPATNQTIAIVSWGTYTNGAGLKVQGGFDANTGATSDLGQYFGSIARSVPDVVIVPSAASSYNGTPDFETTQDICIAATVANEATIAVYFLAYFSTGQYPGQAAWVDLIGRVVHPDPGDLPAGVQPPSVLSCSAYVCGGDDANSLSIFGVSNAWLNAVSSAFQDAALQGVTVVVASGDQGSDSTLGSAQGVSEFWPGLAASGYTGDGKAHVQYPASDPWVLTCGGTTHGKDSGGNPVDYAWNDTDPSLAGFWPAINNATGGGVSAYFTQAAGGVPPWQSGANVPASVNDGLTVGRGVPDVAGNASAITGYNYVVNGAPSLMFGTSAVAPLYAGLVAVINEAINERVGFLNPILYALEVSGAGVCTDIVSHPNVTDNGLNNISGYPVVSGWDACTGWGVIDGSKLLSALQPVLQKTVTLVLQRSTFGKDEVNSLLGNSASYAYKDALYVQVDGFFPAIFGLSSTNLSNPPGLTTWLTFGGTFTGLFASGVTLVFDASTGVQLEDATDLFLVQRITFPFNIQFTSLQAFNGVPASGFMDYSLTAEISTSATAAAGSTPVTATSSAAEIELVLQADPYMVAGETWWLSEDIRVFATAPGALPLTYSNTPWPGDEDPNTYIQNLLTELNTNPNFTNVPPPPTPPPNTPFSGISTAKAIRRLRCRLHLTPRNPVYNFALARVHLQGDSTTLPVRVFFRLFISPSPDTDFNNATTFRSYPNPIPSFRCSGSRPTT